MFSVLHQLYYGIVFFLTILAEKVEMCVVSVEKLRWPGHQEKKEKKLAKKTRWYDDMLVFGLQNESNNYQ